MMSRLRIVLGGGFLASYPDGGGHWMCFLQYLFGLRALGHDVWWLELLKSSRDPGQDRMSIERFFSRMDAYGFGGRVGLLLTPPNVPEITLESAELFGMSRLLVEEVARSADCLWNFACDIRGPLLGLFKHRVLVDVDPGHLQVSALTWDLGILDHQAFLTVGTKLHDRDCSVPTLGVTWSSFLPCIHLPMWTVTPDPGRWAPLTSVTQWTWEELWFDGRVLSVSKRDAYLRYLDLPSRVPRPFELAVNIDDDDDTGDRGALCAHGWRLANPHQIAGSPEAYQAYIAGSRGEFGCPKPIHRELWTGWFSDRSACYVASGRPVLVEDTGFGRRLPTGEGVLVFRNLDEAIAGVEKIDDEWARQSRAARAIAEEFLDSRRCLPAMIAASSGD